MEVGGRPAASRAGGTLAGTKLAILDRRIDPKIAVPTEAPTARVAAAIDVAVPLVGLVSH